MVNKRQGKQLIRQVVQRYKIAKEDTDLNSYPFSEQDLKTKFVVPMLQALNWDIYDLYQVREQKNFLGFLPDYALTDLHGKMILVEVKPDYASNQLQKDLEKYLGNSYVRSKSQVLFLTSFVFSRICVLGKQKGIRQTDIIWEEYISDFNTLWSYMSNSEEGYKKRIYEKAWAPRNPH